MLFIGCMGADIIVWSREVNLLSRKILDIDTNFISCERMQHEIYHGRQIAIDVEHKHWLHGYCVIDLATTQCLCQLLLCFS